ncbi:MAG: lysoplasmalogenase [Oscillospiraceae bacterium]|jgi:uncharacterized membrane protein YhhN|nr:lysoplasmalogenase [Oscillospiraceae bacterium]
MLWLIPAAALPLAGLCVYIPLRIKEKMRPALLIKTALSVLFILYSLYAIKRLTGTGVSYIDRSALIMGLCTVAGMVCGLLGDIWLDLKDIHGDSKHFYMYCGFTSFLIGHLFFMSGMANVLEIKLYTVLLAACVGVVMTLFMFFLEKPMKLDYGKFRPILLIYTFILSLTTALPVICALPSITNGGKPLFPIIFGAGMILFFLSDLILSQVYFSTVNAKPKPLHIALNYIFYYGGQFTLAASLYFLPSVT